MSYGAINRGSKTQRKEDIGFKGGEYDHNIMLGKIIDDGQDGFKFHNALPLEKLFSYIVYAQSIFSPYVTVNVGIKQGKRVVEQFGTRGLQGEEFIKLNFATPKTIKSDKIDDLFYVAGYSPFVRDEHDSSEGMTISCVSKEKLVNDLVTVNQSFNKTTNETAKNIYDHFILQDEKYKKLAALNQDGNTFFKKRDLKSEDPSFGVQNFIIPGLTPFGAMKFLTTRSYGGSKYPGSLYQFYQDNHGYHFVNLEQAIERDKVNPFLTEYTYDPELNDLPHYHKDYYFNIINLTGLRTSNTFENIEHGEYANVVRTIDPYKKCFHDTSFDMKTGYEKFQRTGNHFQLSNKFFDNFASDPIESTIVMDKTRSGEFFDSTIAKRESYQRLMSTYSLTAMVHGNSELNVGRLIKLNLRETGATSHKPKGSMYSGFWFITDLQHIIDKTSFKTKLTLVKDSPEFLHTDKPPVNQRRGLGN